MANQFELNKKLNLEIEEVKKQREQDIADMTRKLRQYPAHALLQKSSADKTDVVTPVPGQHGASRAARANGTLLLLDISRGRGRFWDAPLGKIVRVDLQARQVYINLGSANGMQPETVFNVFVPAPMAMTRQATQGQHHQKSLACWTPTVLKYRLASLALYDMSGQEIVQHLTYSRQWPPGPGSRQRPQGRRGSAVQHLLGVHAWPSQATSVSNMAIVQRAIPAEQMHSRWLPLFSEARNGITVDAYLDLNDVVKSRGAITNRTAT